MKAISFFCVVFVSMLSAFLVATGEVTRWFSGGGERRQLVFNTAPTNSEASPNMLYFPFYNVELGKLSFTIRAELSQDDLEVKDKFDQIRHLTLRNGSLEIPVYDGLALGSTPAPEKDGDAEASSDEAPDPPQQFTLTFETAEWQRPPSNGAASNDGMKVALTNGRGTTNDDFFFRFEELLFLYRSTDDADSYEVSSDRPVSIKNQAFELRSPSGLRGKLRGDGVGLETLTFLPPVTAIIDRKRAPFFQYVTRPETLTAATLNEEGEERTARDGIDDGEGVDRVVITSQGKLELRTLQPNEGEDRRTIIAFHEDVVIRPETNGEGAPDSVQTRFECQYLELAFQEVARRLIPVRALATWEGGRVKAYFEQKRQRGKEGYVIDGDRLEWIYRMPDDPGTVKRGAAAVSQATLYGNPTMTGKGSRFQAREALLDLAEARVLLRDVSGRFHVGRRATIRSTNRSDVRPATDPGRRRLETRGVEGRRGEERETPSLPEDWDMKADEVEFFFTDSSDAGQKLSHFIARSARPGGVVVESAPREPTADGAEPAEEIGGLRLTSNHVTYRTAQKMITFEGTPDAQPNLSQGGNRIGANRIYLSLKKDEELAFFEGEVRARIVDTDRLAAVTGSKVKSEGTPKKKERALAENEPRPEVANGAPGRGPEGPVELSAAQLTVGFGEDGKTISFLRAKGTDAVPARLNSTTGNHFVIEGAELEWNRRDETAIVWGVSPGPTGRPGAEPQPVARPGEAQPEDVVPAPPRLALLEFEGGQLQAQSISFDQKNQTAYLETHVVLECTEGSTSVVVHTGRAEVEFFGDETTRLSGVPGAPGVPGESGILRHLRKVKAFRAHRSERSPIELIGEHFRAYADEAVWDAATSELRFLGGEKQEIRIANEHFKGPIYAREVAYSVKDDLVTLRGEVEGRLTQRLSRGAPKDSENLMEWRFETGRLEVQLHASSETGAPELHSLRAREWVHLTSTKDGLALMRLLGDALDFDATSGKVTVFSPAGRPQTFFRMAAAGADDRDEIIAQRILLLPVEYPDARFGESRSWLNVVFEQNVKAVFRPLAQRRSRSKKSGTKLARVPTNEPWKLDTEKLILRVDPGQAPSGMVTWATAHGGVTLKLGVYTATGDRAEYKDLSQTLVLTGNPARLTAEDRQGRTYKKENERIVIQREGDQISIQLGGRSRTKSR